MPRFWFRPRLVADAASGDSFAVGRCLLAGDDVNERNYCGSNALLVAVQYNHKAVIYTLLRCRYIDVNLPDTLGLTALMKAAMCGNIKIVDMLCKHPAIDVNKQDNKGWTAFMHARGNIGIIRILLTVYCRNRMLTYGQIRPHATCHFWERRLTC
jgi:ankyrin repeat protein